MEISVGFAAMSPLCTAFLGSTHSSPKCPQRILGVGDVGMTTLGFCAGCTVSESRTSMLLRLEK